MKSENFNFPVRKIRVLVAPLDWGLGHAARCIPIISHLISLNVEVIVAAEGAVKTLLQQEFPQLTFLPLKGYRMNYSRKKYWLPLRMFFQIPKIIRSVCYEHRWLKKIIQQNKIDAVISDNRFGLSHSTVHCIFITHQLKIKTGNHITDWLAQKINYYFINKYNSCWVPDFAGEINLAGILSHPKHLPKLPVKYIGPLSRFEKIEVEKKIDLAIILSGPEPQRTILENILLKDLENYKGNCLFVRGVFDNDKNCDCKNFNVEIHNHLSAKELNVAIQQSQLVICRSGYTSVMDLIKLQQKAMLVATPGQTEQEYLAKILMKKKFFYVADQNNFSLTDVLKNVERFPFVFLNINQEEHKNIVEEFIDDLLKK